jgi:hypothetical protein
LETSGFEAGASGFEWCAGLGLRAFDQIQGVAFDGSQILRAMILADTGLVAPIHMCCNDHLLSRIRGHSPMRHEGIPISHKQPSVSLSNIIWEGNYLLPSSFRRQDQRTIVANLEMATTSSHLPKAIQTFQDSSALCI